MIPVPRSPFSGGEMKVRNSYGELVAILAASALHVGLEVAISESVALVFSGVVSVAFLFYLVIRARRHSGMSHAWGFRRAGFRRALFAHAPFTAIGSVALLAFGAVREVFPPPATFWLVLLLYPVWGVAQQFALQNLLARNLAPFVRSPVALSLTAAALFAAAHYPRLDLAALTFVAGFFLTIVYRRQTNLWAVGIAHGVLGALAVYCVIGEDPGAAILRFISR